MRAILRSTLALALTATCLTAVAGLAPPAVALDNGLARTPQMGWNDWNSFGCSVSDTLVRQTADAMVASGMAAAGYAYVNIDDCWSTRT
ncbi:alpha-galactosidase, partial [Nonomuraea sp. NPDC001023]